jgi:hypothetical protein
MATPAAILSVLVEAKGIRGATHDLNKVDKAGRNAASGMSKFQKVAGAGILAVGAAAAAAGPKLIDLASDAEETASKFRIVFGKETQNAIKNLDEFSKATGTSKFALREQAAGLQALIKPMGVAGKASSQMSIGLTKLATDLASFNNTSVQDAVDALKGGLVGEAEPLRKYSVQLSEARVQAFAYAQGIAKQGAELTVAQKAQARYGIILKDTKLAQGDAIETSGSFANQLKRLKSQVTDAATELGVKLLPAATLVVSQITKFIGQMQSGQGVGGAFITVLQSLRETIRGTAANVRDLVAWFRRHKTTTDVLISVVTGLTAAFVAYKVATIAATVATRAFAAATTLLSLAMRLNPIGIVVTALIALGAALVTAYKRSETFRRIVDTAFAKVKSAGTTAFNAIKSAIDPVLDVFEKILDVVKDVVSFIGKIKVPDIDIPFIGGDPKTAGEKMVATGGTGGTWGYANKVASLFGLRPSSSYRSPSHNAAVGGVPGSLHTHGSPRNPGAIDLVGSAASMYAASAWAARHIPGLKENLVHDAGSGLHLHLGFFKRGGKVPGSGPGDKVPAMLEAGEFVVRKQVVDKFGPTFFTGLNGMAGGGIVGAAKAAKAAGFKGQALINAVAIAGAESGYNPGAQNLRYPDHSIGLWQINQLAHKGRWGSDSALKNPMTNARAAYDLWRESGFSPWSTWPTAAQGYQARAAKAVADLMGANKKSAKSKSKPKNYVKTPSGAIGKKTRGAMKRLAAAVKPGTKTAADRALLAGLQAQQDLASLTSGTADDLLAGDALVTYWENRLGRAQKNGGAAGISEAAQGLKSARDFVGGIRQEEADRLAAAIEEQNSLNRELIANQLKVLALASQGDQIVGAVVAAVNGGIGGRVGLGFHGIRSTPGSVANL